MKKTGRYRVGDTIRLAKRNSVTHFATANMPITGTITEIVPPKETYNATIPGFLRGHTLYRIRFTDGRTGLYRRNEIRRIG